MTTLGPWIVAVNDTPIQTAVDADTAWTVFYNYQKIQAMRSRAGWVGSLTLTDPAGKLVGNCHYPRWPGSPAPS